LEMADQVTHLINSSLLTYFSPNLAKDKMQ